MSEIRSPGSFSTRMSLQPSSGSTSLGCDCEPINEWPVTGNEKYDTPSHDDVCQLNNQLATTHSETQEELISIDTDSVSKKKVTIHHSHKTTLKRCFEQESDTSNCFPSKLAHKEILFAKTSLARWWRQEGKFLCDQHAFPQTCNPNTLLHHISRTKEGQGFLESERRKFENVIRAGECDSQVWAALGTVEECLGNLDKAKDCLGKAVVEGNDKEHRWLLHKVEKQIQIQQQQQKLMKNISGTQLKLRSAKEVKRVSADTLSLKEFFYSYALTSTPVVITDLVDKMTSNPWTLEHIARVAGDVSVTLKKPVEHSVEWAGLEEGDRMTVQEYIDTVLRSNLNTKQQQYLFDWSLPIHCPRLAQDLKLPRYFAGDFLQRTSKSSLYQDSWPSLFVAPAGLCSQLHIDAFASNFWMALFQGKKRWTFYSKEDAPCLYPTFVHSMDPIFEVDVTSPDLEKHPLLSIVQPLQCDLQEGEVLFVPSGCPHHVQNLEASVAISANFVDLSNFTRVQKELEISSLVDPRSHDLLKQFQSPSFKPNMDSTLGDLSWNTFKCWSPEHYETFDITPETIAANLK